MSKQINKYLTLWNKYKPAIVSYMKAATTMEEQQYQLTSQEFTMIGDRDKSGYSFSLEIQNGVLANDIGGIAVASDLLQTLKTSPAALRLFENNYFKIRMDKNFKLHISCELITEGEEVAAEMASEAE